MMTKFPHALTLAAGLIAVPLSLTACEADDFDDAEALAADASFDDASFADEGTDDGFRDSSTTRLWDPKDINPAWCQEGEPSRPPTDGKCEIELRLTRTKLVTGQGASEGRAELSTVVTATAPNGNQIVANVAEKKYTAGEADYHDISLGTYTVLTGNQKNISVCAEFTEHDNGGANGQDDVGSACTNVTLSCDPVDGQPSFSRIIGPAPLCGPNQCNGSASARVKVMRADADLDGVPNIDDATPEPCDELEKGTEGVALVLYYHYDDDDFTTLAQSLGSNLSKHYGAYDFVALVMDNDTSNLGNVDGKAFSEADVVFEPSRAGMLDAIRLVTSLGYRFDVKTHAHGYKAGADDSSLEVLAGGRISGDWLVDATDPNLIGTARGGIPIVALWGTSCYQARQIDAWSTVGALTASGAFDINFLPNAWGNYWDLWVAGNQYQTAVDLSVTAGVVTASESMIAGQGAGNPWWCVAPTVLGQNPCAEDFFNDDVGANEAAYNLQAIYNHSLSGAQNMEIASERSFIGNTATTFGGGAAVWP